MLKLVEFIQCRQHVSEGAGWRLGSMSRRKGLTGCIRLERRSYDHVEGIRSQEKSRADGVGHTTGLEVVGFCHVQTCDFAWLGLGTFVGKSRTSIDRRVRLLRQTQDSPCSRVC